MESYIYEQKEIQMTIIKKERYSATIERERYRSKERERDRETLIFNRVSFYP